jgi:hypothetical protein
LQSIDTRRLVPRLRQRLGATELIVNRRQLDELDHQESR